jgi:hypothetical protein
MKRLSALAAALLLAGTFAAAAVDLKTDTFQVTGEVSAVDNDSITVMKGKERFHITKDAATKSTGDVKVGAKVTIKYQMYAKDIEAKAEKAAKAPAKKK